MDTILSQMTAEDIDEIISIGVSQREFSSANGSFWKREQLERWCESSSDITLVAKKNGGIIGFSLFAIHVPTRKVTWENIYVRPSFRRMGVATRMAEEGLKRIKDMGYSYIMMAVNADDKESVASFAEKIGFKRGNLVLWVDKIFS